MTENTKPLLGNFTCLWIGLSVAAGFLTPMAAFQSGLPLPQPFAVVRTSFQFLVGLEWILLAGLTAIWFFGQKSKPILVGLVLIGLLLVLRSSFVLPSMMARTDVLLAGGTNPPSVLHHVSMAVEIIKLAILSGLVWLARRGS